MEIPVFEFEKAELDVLYEQRYLCKNNAECVKKMQEFDKEMKALFCENALLQAQPQKWQQNFFELIKTVFELAIFCDGSIKIFFSAKEKTASVEVSAPAFIFQKEEIAGFVNALHLSTEVGFYPSLDDNDESAMRFDYCLFDERSRYLNAVEKTIQKSEEQGEDL